MESILSSPDALSQALRYSQLIGRPIDNTVLSAYMQCARRGLYMAWLHRRKDGAPTPALAFGTWWHHALECHFTHPECSQSELEQDVELYVAERLQDHQVLDDHRTFQRLMLEYRKYLKTYGLPWREEARTVGWPDRPLVETSTELAIPGARHPYAGKLDRIILKGGQYLVEDHKTASRADSFAAYEMDNQMIGYAVMAQLLTGLPIVGVRIDRLVVRKNDSELERRTISYSQDRLEHWMKNYDRQLARLERDLEEFQQNPDIATTDAFPLNFSACHGKYGMCVYAGVCSLPPRLWQNALEDDFAVVPWNPLAVEGGEDV